MRTSTPSDDWAPGFERRPPRTTGSPTPSGRVRGTSQTLRGCAAFGTQQGPLYSGRIRRCATVRKKTLPGLPDHRHFGPAGRCDLPRMRPQDVPDRFRPGGAVPVGGVGARRDSGAATQRRVRRLRRDLPAVPRQTASDDYLPRCPARRRRRALLYDSPVRRDLALTRALKRLLAVIGCSRRTNRFPSHQARRVDRDSNPKTDSP